MILKPRQYQIEAAQAPFDYWSAGNVGNPVIALPTGTGKSIVIPMMIAHTYRLAPAFSRSLVLTHVKELVEQNAKKMGQYWRGAPYGVYSAGLKQRDTMSQFIFASIQSVYKRIEMFASAANPVHIVYVDECHLISDKDETMYMAVFDYLRKLNPHLKIVGLTATWWRLGMGPLTNGRIFDEIVYDKTQGDDFNWFIDEGYLAPLITKRTDTQINLEGLHRRGGDWNESELNERIDSDDLLLPALREMLHYGQTRRCGIIFASGIEVAEHIADILTAFGENAVAVHSKQKSHVRDANIAAYKNDEVKYIVSKGILTTGFDDPKTDMIADLAPTLSPGMHVQKYGRGTRPDYADGFDLDEQAGRLAAISASFKRNCLVLDYSRNTWNNGPINYPIIPKAKGAGGGDPPVWICDDCGAYNHAAARFCIVCGAEHVFENKVKQEAGEEEVIRRGEEEEPPVESFEVNRIYTDERTARNGKSIMKVVYACGFKSFSEVVCFEHDGWPGKKARDWWRARDPSGSDPPATTAEALDRVSALAVPCLIEVKMRKDHPEIIGYKYV